MGCLFTIFNLHVEDRKSALCESLLYGAGHVALVGGFPETVGEESVLQAGDVRLLQPAQGPTGVPHSAQLHLGRGVVVL